MLTKLFSPRRFGQRLAAAVSLAALSGGLAGAQVDVDANLTVTLDNALTITEDTAVDFGTLTLLPDPATGGENIVIRLTPAGALVDDSVAPAAFLTLTPGAAGQYTVSTGVPSFTNLSISIPATGTSLTAAGAPPGNGALAVTLPTFAAAVGTIVTPCNAADPVVCIVQTDATGNFTFNLGFTITAVDDTAYQSTATAYTGTVTLTADFS